jgi:DNA-binding response OmpR family regulator
MTTILVVDDDATARRTTQYILQSANYTVVPACDAAQAHMHLMRMHCDLLIMEIASLRFDGLALLRSLRAARQHHDLPVIVLTSNGHKREHRRALQLGAALCLSKPVQSDVLVSVVHCTLHQCAASDQALVNLSLTNLQAVEDVPVELAM